jgi:DNA-directed RNA polymerase sigma subunit (sigma70/sigma32)
MMMAGHLSVATIEALNKIVRTCRNLRQLIGREPTAQEIAGMLDMPPEMICKLLGAPPPPTAHLSLQSQMPFSRTPHGHK